MFLFLFCKFLKPILGNDTFVAPASEAIGQSDISPMVQVNCGAAGGAVFPFLGTKAQATGEAPGEAVPQQCELFNLSVFFSQFFIFYFF